MIQKNRIFSVLCLSLSMTFFSGVAGMISTPAVDRVLQNGFPAQPEKLALLTENLFQEYKENGNSGSLVFYSWGMLRQANYFLSVNNIIEASEYAKIGFFYLDEAVDLNENEILIRYLRARVDAYLPASLGRCVVTIKDTALLLQEKEKFSDDIVKYINEMRLRALNACKMYDKANLLLAQLQQRYPGFEINFVQSDSPAWNISEVTQIILPVIKGD